MNTRLRPQLKFAILLTLMAVSSFGAGRANAAEHQQEIRIWLAWPDRGIEAALQEWERRNPGFIVTTSAYLNGQDPQKLMTSIAGGNPPQVIVQDRSMVGEWAYRGAFSALDDRLAKAGVRAEDFYSAAWNEAVYQGKNYAIPYNIDARALYYNKSMLIEAGLVDDKGEARPPKDWDELEHYTTALTKRDATGHVQQLGFSPNFGNSWLYMFAWLNGGEMMSRDGTHVTMNSPAVADALDYMTKLYDSVGGIEVADAFTSATSGDAFEPFITRRLAMKIDGDWFLNNAAEYAPNLQFAVAPPPAPKGKPSTTWSGGFSLAIPATAKHQDQAFDLARFLTSEEGFDIWHQANQRYAASQGRGFIPRLAARPRVNERVLHERIEKDPNLPPHIVAAVRVFLDLLPNCRYRPVTPIGQFLWDEQIRAMDRTTRTHMPAMQSLNESAAKVQEKLDRTLQERGAGPKRQVPVLVIVVATAFVLAILVSIFVALARRHRGEIRRDEMLAAGGFLSPWIIGFVFLTAAPIVASLIFSFCRYDVLHPPEWVGGANYSKLVHDPLFWKSLGNTLYMLMAVPLGIVLGLGIAMMLNANVPGMKFYRTLFYMPAVVPVVASSVLWVWVLNPTNGLINSALRMIGIANVPLWLASPTPGFGSKAAIVIMLLWGAGSGMVVWLAGLKGIPKHLYEAAAIDGAGPIRTFFNVTFPMLTPYIFFNTVMGVISIMQIFTQALVMPKEPGGPVDSTLFFALHLFNSAFRMFDMGYAAALGWVMMLIVLVLTLVQWRASRRWVTYDMT